MRPKPFKLLSEEPSHQSPDMGLEGPMGPGCHAAPPDTHVRGISQHRTGTFARRISMGYASSINLPFLLGVLRSPEARLSTRVGWFGFFWRSPNQTEALTPHAPGFHPQNPLKRSCNGTVLSKEEAAGHTSPPSLQGAAKRRSGPLLPGDPSLTHLPEPPKLQALL